MEKVRTIEEAINLVVDFWMFKIYDKKYSLNISDDLTSKDSLDKLPNILHRAQVKRLHYNGGSTKQMNSFKSNLKNELLKRCKEPKKYNRFKFGDVLMGATSLSTDYSPNDFLNEICDSVGMNFSTKPWKAQTHITSNHQVFLSRGDLSEKSLI